ncbi:MAG: alpha-L-rhamnosidase [Puniceicoccaceae bacterium]|nr:MAG: alpha-L-rhamnosidase [Puniceicoccaceae bacterium]
MDLSPARWIWLPSERTPANTFVVFRRSLDLPSVVPPVSGYISADSRYRVCVNGRFVQFGPGPCDPRELEADPLDLTPFLQPGENRIEITVLFYGHGEGTWVCGKPGLIVRLEIGGPSPRLLISDRDWLCRPDPSRPPGGPKRSYLRALQEIADLTLPETDWRPALELDLPADRPPLAGHYLDYQTDAAAASSECRLVPRGIPLLKCDEEVEARPVYSRAMIWKRNPEEWFAFRAPDSFEIPEGADIHDLVGASCRLPAAVRGPDSRSTAAILTCRLPFQLVGWPFLEVESEGESVIEILLQESHDPDRNRWMDTHHFRWIRLTCPPGRTCFQAFEFDSAMWIQLHVRDNPLPVTIHRVGLRHRVYPFAQPAAFTLGEPALQRLADACIRTVWNNAHDTLVDCMGRERQQYSGDGGHEILALLTAFGESRHPARYLKTWSQGQTREGYFLDCWPAWDRMNRIPQRMLGLTPWGPLLDHSIGFVFDTWHFWLCTGQREAVADLLPRFERFLGYLESLVLPDGLLPVEDLGIPTVWIDHDAYREQREKQCAFTLYAEAMLRTALAPLARDHGYPELANGAEKLAATLLHAARITFWCAATRSFVNNLPWRQNNADSRWCDRSLATALLFDQCPDSDTTAAVRLLAKRPASLGFSYVPNQIWRHRALARAGRIDILLHEYRTEWAELRSVRENGTISEFWNPRPDSKDQFSHLGVFPLIVLHHDLVGLRPTSPGYASYEVYPQLGDIRSLDTTCHTPAGPLRFSSRLQPDGRQSITLTAPPEGAGRLKIGSETRPLIPGVAFSFELPA